MLLCCSLESTLVLFDGLMIANKIKSSTSIDSNKLKTLKLTKMPNVPPNCVSKFMNVVWGDSVTCVY